MWYRKGWGKQNSSLHHRAPPCLRAESCWLDYWPAEFPVTTWGCKIATPLKFCMFQSTFTLDAKMLCGLFDFFKKKFNHFPCVLVVRWVGGGQLWRPSGSLLLYHELGLYPGCGSRAFPAWHREEKQAATLCCDRLWGGATPQRHEPALSQEPFGLEAEGPRWQ